MRARDAPPLPHGITVAAVESRDLGWRKRTCHMGWARVSHSIRMLYACESVRFAEGVALRCLFHDWSSIDRLVLVTPC